MNIRSFIITMIVLLSLSGCTQITNKPQGSSSPSSEVTSNESKITEGPNLKLIASISSSTDIGNGMKRVRIDINGENASKNWYYYSMLQPMSGEDVPDAILTTTQGNSYNSVYSLDIDSGYGPRETYGVAPGAIFSAIGGYNANFPEGFNEIADSSWSIVYFDIPSGATADTLTVSYKVHPSPLDANTSDDYRGTYQSKVKLSTKNDNSPILNPFDSAYKKYSMIYSTGDQLNFGEIAFINVQSVENNSDGSLNVSISITSTDNAYPIQFDVGATSYLVFQNGVNCSLSYLDNPDNWEGDQVWDIGPMQSATVTSSFENPSKLAVWLVIQGSISEANVANSSGPKSVYESYIVKIK